MPIRLDAYNHLSVSAAIGYARLHGARVISMSFGGQTNGPLAFSEPAVRDAVSDAFQNNVTLCAATMNNGTKNFIPYPAAYPQVIACGASLINEDQRKANSNYGEDPNSHGMLSVVAPGECIITTANKGEGDSSDGDYSLTFGDTSAATPHVAALAALMISIKPRITSQQVKDIIELTADKSPSAAFYTTTKTNGQWNPELGYGRINIAAAVDRARLIP
jgi:subtilisin family serine protease